MSTAIAVNNVDEFHKIINAGIARSAGMLNKITRSHTTLSVPEFGIVPVDKFDEIAFSRTGEKPVAVSLDFSGPFSGRTAVVFPRDIAAELAMAVAGEEWCSPDLDVMKSEVLKEVGNILVSGVMVSISDALKSTFSYSIPVYGESVFEDLIRDCENSTGEYVAAGRIDFTISGLEISGEIVIILEKGSLEHLLKSVRNA